MSKKSQQSTKAAEKPKVEDSKPKVEKMKRLKKSQSAQQLLLSPLEKAVLVRQQQAQPSHLDWHKKALRRLSLTLMLVFVIWILLWAVKDVSFMI